MSALKSLGNLFVLREHGAESRQEPSLAPASADVDFEASADAAAETPQVVGFKKPLEPKPDTLPGPPSEGRAFGGMPPSGHSPKRAQLDQHQQALLNMMISKVLGSQIQDLKAADLVQELYRSLEYRDAIAEVTGPVTKEFVERLREKFKTPSVTVDGADTAPAAAAEGSTTAVETVPEAEPLQAASGTEGSEAAEENPPEGPPPYAKELREQLAEKGFVLLEEEHGVFDKLPFEKIQPVPLVTLFDLEPVDGDLLSAHVFAAYHAKGFASSPRWAVLEHIKDSTLVDAGDTVCVWERDAEQYMIVFYKDDKGKYAAVARCTGRKLIIKGMKCIGVRAP